MDGDHLHIVLFPWLAFGHMIPYLELAKSLAHRGHRVSFVSTPRNLQRLPPHPAVEFVPLPLPPTEGLPDGAEATSDVVLSKVQYLKKALDGLRDPFARFLSEASPRPDWVLVDFAQYWAPPAATELGIPCVFFSIYMAVFMSYMGPPEEAVKPGYYSTPESLTVSPAWVDFPTSAVHRIHEAKVLWEVSAPAGASGVSDFMRYGLTLGACKAVAIRTVEEVESQWLSLLRRIMERPVVPVGLLVPGEEAARPGGEQERGEEEMLLGWLDNQPPKSVVYVAFGSEARLPGEMVKELALGLELSGLPFVWVLRELVEGEGAVLLPEVLEEKGKVMRGWVPQMKVLGHAAVGGFMTHCGWSSVIEGLQFGHPLVLLPIFADQGLNTRAMQEKMIGVEVARREEDDGAFSKEEVARAIRLVMVDDAGEPFRRTAAEMSPLFRDKRYHESHVDALVGYLRQAHTD